MRLISRRELPNLLWAVKGALADRAEDVITFITCVDKFLNDFGLKRDRVFLTEQLAPFISAVGSQNWYLVLSNQGDRLFQSAKYSDASKVFTEILQGLSIEPSYNRIKILIDLGKCCKNQGQLTTAVQYLQDGLNLSQQLKSSQAVKSQRGRIYGALGDVLMDLGEFQQARRAYEDSLAIDRDLGDRRSSASTSAQMGTLAMLQGDMKTAIELHKSALGTFQQLQDSANESVAWHQLGLVYGECQRWTEAEQAYRESMQIEERQGNVAGAANTYCQLAIISMMMDKPVEAESWSRKALEGHRIIENKLGESLQSYNLAVLIVNQSGRLSEAKQLATAALATRETLDPAAEIWKVYGLLAMISTAQNEPDKAKEYRHLARTTKAAFAGTQYELQRHAQFIELMVAAVGDTAARVQLEPELVRGVENGKGRLVTAIRRVLAGEREVEALWDDLDADDSMIIDAIVRRII
jgi:tetratricopeptide (TPR) repeat protein